MKRHQQNSNTPSKANIILKRKGDSSKHQQIRAPVKILNKSTPAHQYRILGAEIQTSLFYKTAALKEHNEGWLYNFEELQMGTTGL